MINKILIANRGEIAVRVIRTARELGIRTVAVYSTADAGALHVLQADEAVCIGAAPVGESYLVAEKILDAAKLTGSDAIHPGYGFLSENAGFARACEAGGITFIGPTADAIELMGSKRLSKIAMIEAGVPCVPGYQGADQSEQVLIEQAAKIGFPLMVKASAGGGGRGMRLVFEASELVANLKTARSEAESAFGSGELILERAVLEPRHIEIQVFADNFGNVVYLGERDCSIQRRHQKVVEESPSPFVDETLRCAMGDAAVNAAKACNYRGAGTVEFLVDSDRNFYFLEMNTRLQVEHPVTELVTGQDLVAWQITVAEGRTLPLTQDQIRLDGHAIEVRIYAEDPREQFMPQTGHVLKWQVPERVGIRTDTGIQTGQQITPHYDPMLAKVISYGENREIACRRLASALQDSELLGLNNNRLFLERIIRHPVFADGQATTAFIEQHFKDDISLSANALSAQTVALAAVVNFQLNHSDHIHSDWHNPVPYGYQYKLGVADNTVDVSLSREGQDFTIKTLKTELVLGFISMDEHYLRYTAQGVQRSAVFARKDNQLFLDDGTGHVVFSDLTQNPAMAGKGTGSSDIKASMDGAIVDVLVAEGDQVESGQTLVVLEAMKMEHQLKAAVSGRVESVLTLAGEQVKTKQLLVKVTAAEE